MKQQEPVPLLAIDIGSSSIKAMCARRTTDGLVYVVGCEQSSCSPDEISQGVIIKPFQIGAKVMECVVRLAKRCKVREVWTQAFVCLGGKSMQINSVSVKREAHKRHTNITQELLDEMDSEVVTKIENNLNNAVPVSVVGYYPVQYIVDGDVQDEPPTEEQTYSRIQIDYIVFVGIKELRKKVFSALNQARLNIETYFARPDVLFSILTTPEECERGCAIIDMGCQTTTLTIYKGNMFTFTYTLPKGGDDITQMLSDEHLPFVVAEQVKVQYGSCEYGKEVTLQIALSDGTACITTTQITDIIRGVIDDLFTTLFTKSGDMLQGVSKIYLTGGGALLKGLRGYLQEKITVPILCGSHAVWLDGARTQNEYCSPEYASLIGTLKIAFDYAAEHTSKKRGGLMTNIIDLFTQSD